MIKRLYFLDPLQFHIKKVIVEEESVTKNSPKQQCAIWDNTAHVNISPPSCMGVALQSAEVRDIDHNYCFRLEGWLLYSEKFNVCISFLFSHSG